MYCGILNFIFFCKNNTNCIWFFCVSNFRKVGNCGFHWTSKSQGWAQRQDHQSQRARGWCKHYFCSRWWFLRAKAATAFSAS